MNHTNDTQVTGSQDPIADGTEQEKRAWICLFLAWSIAAISTLGVLFVGEVMGQTPCIVCWYQRAFMFPLAAILGIAAVRSDYAVWRYAIPLAYIGAGFAGYHSLLYVGVISENLSPCSQGVSCTSGDMVMFGLFPLPILSLGSFLGIVALNYIATRRNAS